MNTLVDSIIRAKFGTRSRKHYPRVGRWLDALPDDEVNATLHQLRKGFKKNIGIGREDYYDVPYQYVVDFFMAYIADYLDYGVTQYLREAKAVYGDELVKIIKRTGAHGSVGMNANTTSVEFLYFYMGMWALCCGKLIERAIELGYTTVNYGYGCAVRDLGIHYCNAIGRKKWFDSIGAKKAVTSQPVAYEYDRHAARIDPVEPGLTTAASQRAKYNFYFVNEAVKMAFGKEFREDFVI